MNTVHSRRLHYPSISLFQNFMLPVIVSVRFLAIPHIADSACLFCKMAVWLWFSSIIYNRIIGRSHRKRPVVRYATTTRRSTLWSPLMMVSVVDAADTPCRCSLPSDSAAVTMRSSADLTSALACPLRLISNTAS